MKYLVLFMALFSVLGTIGIKYGLPDHNRPLPYNVDELTWIEALSHTDNFIIGSCGGAPPFYGYILGAALKASSMLGMVKLAADKNYYIENKNEWRNLFIIGRILQIISGLWSIYFIYLLGLTAFSKKTGLIAAGLFSISPAVIGTAHFSQANLPVTLFALAATYYCFKIISDRGRLKWYLLSGILCGVAIVTKYSAAPLVIILLLSHLLSRPYKLINKNIFSAYLVMSVIAVVFSCLNSPKEFWNGFQYLTKALALENKADMGIFFSLAQPFIYPLHYSFGPVLLLSCLAGIVFSAVKIKNENNYRLVLLSFIFTFYLFMVKMGASNSISRTLIIAPYYLLFGANFIETVLARDKKAGFFIAALILLTTGSYTFILETHYISLPVQKKASIWITGNIPENEKIAVPCTYWWTPDILYMTRQYTKPYNIIDAQYDPSRINPEVNYVAVTFPESVKARAGSGFPGENDTGTFMKKVEDEFDAVKTFPRQLDFFGLAIPFPENPLFVNDIIWSPGTVIYKRK